MLKNKVSKLKDNVSDFHKFLESDDLNCSFSLGLDSDIDTDDVDINENLMSPL